MAKNLILLFSLIILTGRAQVAGPNNPTAATNLMCSFAYSSTVGYAPAGDVFASDNSYAMATHCDCCDQNTQCLTVNHFNFTIPAGATIDGIVLEVERHRSFGSSSMGSVVDNGIQLMKAGVNVGANYMNTITDWPTADAYATYGSPTDLWGTTWTPADINAVGFGAAIASISYFCGVTVVTSIDHVRITVYYTSTTGVSNTIASDGGLEVYPNPVIAGNKITFEQLEKLEEFSLSDVLGKEVYHGSSNTNNISIPEIEPGTYFIQIINKEGKYKSKITIRK